MDRRGLNPLRDLALLRRLRTTFLSERPDLVLGFTPKNNIYGAIAARQLQIPFVPNVTGLGTAFLGNSVLRSVAESLYRSAFRAAPAVLFQNCEDRNLFIERGLVRPSQAHVVPGSGIDLLHFAPAPLPECGSAPTFLLVGRVLKDKGVLEFVEAARAVRRHHPSARFQLLGAIGSDNRSAISRTDVNAWRDNGWIEYLGVVDDVRGAIAKAHCVILPSYREGAPRTLIEAAAMARPVIATDVPGCRSVVEHGKTGLLCAAQDAASLAEACKRVIGLSRDELELMGRLGRRKMEREFDHAIVARTYREIIPQALGLK
jgi:glycosyltransferase involved in cell wall biosynthesis